LIKKVLFINTFDDPRHGLGAEFTLRHLTLGLSRQGVDVAIASTAPENGIARFERDGIRVWRVGIENIYWPQNDRRPSVPERAVWHTIDRWNPRMQDHLRRILRQERPEVVSVHNLAGWSAGVWQTVRQQGIPSVQVLHDFYNLCIRGTMYRRGHTCATQCLLCRLYRARSREESVAVDAVVGVSDFVLRRHLDGGLFAGVSTRKVIHNARDRLELGAVNSGEILRDRRTPRVGYIGRVAPWKGIELLLEVVGRSEFDQIELWVAGAGDAGYQESIRSRFQRPNTRFLGRVEPKEFYPNVDVVVVPSTWEEPLGMVVGEAFAFGRPVIGARRGGIPEMVSDGKNGILFDADRPAELAAALRRVLSDSEALRAMAVEAEIAGQQYTDVSAWVARYLAVYEGVLSTTASKPPLNAIPHG
jgi:glycosyltransferase involved in cell wall biosynthesis